MLKMKNKNKNNLLKIKTFSKRLILALICFFISFRFSAISTEDFFFFSKFVVVLEVKAFEDFTEANILLDETEEPF
jgi:hypothetical protein